MVSRKPCRLLQFFAVLGLLAVSAAAQSRPIPIVLDTDIGTDIDDAFALALVLKSPELDLRAVTTVSGDTQARARIAAKMLWVAGRRTVPVAAGTPGGKLEMAQAHWAESFTSPELVQESAVELMKSKIDAAHGTLVIVAVGPLTNLAALLQQYPVEKGNIQRIVLMGGSIARGYTPGSGPTAEYNIAADARAAQVVFSSGIPIEIAPLDVTAALQLDEARRHAIFQQNTPLTQALQELYRLWGQPTPTLHDPMAVALLLDPKLTTRKRMAVTVTDQGMTVAEAGKTANAEVAVGTVPAHFLDFYVSHVTR